MPSSLDFVLPFLLDLASAGSGLTLALIFFFDIIRLRLYYKRALISIINSYLTAKKYSRKSVKITIN